MARPLLIFIIPALLVGCASQEDYSLRAHAPPRGSSAPVTDPAVLAALRRVPLATVEVTPRSTFRSKDLAPAAAELLECGLKDGLPAALEGVLAPAGTSVVEERAATVTATTALTLDGEGGLWLVVTLGQAGRGWRVVGVELRDGGHPLVTARPHDGDPAPALLEVARTTTSPRALHHALEVLLTHGDPAVRAAAADVFAGSAERFLAGWPSVAYQQAFVTLADLQGVAAVPVARTLLRTGTAVSARAAVILAENGERSPEVLAGLRAALGDGDWRLRLRAARALGLHRAGAEDEVALLERLEDSVGEVRRAAAEAARRFELGAAHLEVLGRLRTAPDWQVRLQAVRLLARCEEPAATELLAESLGDPVGEVRFAAQEGLGGRPLAPALGVLVKLLGSPDWQVRLVVTRFVATEPSRRATSALIGRLVDPVREVQRAAHEALQRRGLPEDAVGELRPLLTAPDWQVRLSTLRLVAALPGDEAPGLIGERLVDPVGELRREAFDLLARREGPVVRDAYLAAAGAPDWQVRVAAAGGLARFDDEAARVGLARLLGDPVGEVRRAADEALARRRLGAAEVAVVAEHLEAADWQLRIVAARHLGRSDVPAAREALIARAGVEPVGEVVRAIQQALKR